MESALSRRWPPIVAAILGAVLVFLVLPNPLSVPQTNPSASAEYAPVPGKQEEAQSANFSQTSTATSAGIGDSGEGVGALPGVPPPPLPEFRPRQKECVGNPPRQTEDPLSPPCVPFFEGKNGGATFTGVTKDTINIVLYNDRCCGENIDMNSPWKPSEEGSCAYPWDCEHIVRTVKALHRYFNKRYQLYGRQVRLFAVRSTGEVGGACSTRQADALTSLQYKPFAVVSFVQGSQNCYFEEMAKRKIPVFGNNEDAPERLYTDNRPYAYGFLPTQEVQGQWSASFVCNKLDFKNSTAKFTDDPLLLGKPRKFGFIRPGDASRGDELMLNAAKFDAELKRLCNFKWDAVGEFTGRTAAGSKEANGIMTRFKRESITTVVCYCIPRPTELTVGTMQKAASSIEYYPEWYWDAATAMDRGVWQRMFGSPDHTAFGSTYYWRAGPFKEQYHYRAYASEEPGSEPSAYWNSRVYTLFLNLFSAIQAAGPELTPENIEKGMTTFNYTNQADVWTPTGGYGAYSPKAISEFTWVDSAMGWWWDPAGTPPGGIQGEGCLHAVRQGMRVYWNEWPKGDGDLFNPEDPCTQDHYKVKDPNGGT